MLPNLVSRRKDSSTCGNSFWLREDIKQLKKGIYPIQYYYNTEIADDSFAPISALMFQAQSGG